MPNPTPALLFATIGLASGCQLAPPDRPPADSESPAALETPAAVEVPKLAPRPKASMTTNIAAPAGDFAFQDAGGAGRTMPLGIGFTASPGMFLLSGSADFPIDDHLTAGPALQFGGDENTSMFSAFGQLRYWLPVDDDEPTIKPFLQGGAGTVYLDKENRSGDWGLLLNAGGGIRVLTGKDYRIASTMLFNFVPGDVAGESGYFTWELISVVVDF